VKKKITPFEYNLSTMLLLDIAQGVYVVSCNIWF